MSQVTYTKYQDRQLNTCFFLIAVGQGEDMKSLCFRRLYGAMLVFGIEYKQVRGSNHVLSDA